MALRSAAIAFAVFLVSANGVAARALTGPISAVQVTALGETGSIDLDATADQIVVDTANTRSYGFLGLNTRGDLPEFVRLYGNQLDLRGAPGSREFDQSWCEAARR